MESGFINWSGEPVLSTFVVWSDVGVTPTVVRCNMFWSML